MNNPACITDWPVRRYAVTGTLALVLLLAGFGTWLAVANLSGAIIIQGRLTQARESLEIQHLNGGVVSAVMVSEGQMVQVNDILIKLNDTAGRSELAVLDTRLLELSARRARLAALRDGARQISFPSDLLANTSGGAALRGILDGQVRLFDVQQQSWAQQNQAIRENTAQIAIQITGIDAQLDALRIQHRLILAQLADQKRLMDKGLATARAVLSFEREAAIIQGKIGASVAQRASARAQISQIETELLRAQSKRREDTISQLRDVEFRLNQLAEKRQLLLVSIDNMRIRAPGPGIVLDLGPIALNSVVKPAEVLMLIVPAVVPDRITARLAPLHIEQLYLHQPVDIRFSTPGHEQTPRLPGTITAISPATLSDPTTGKPYYQVEIAYSQAELARLTQAPEVFFDMPVELFIKTGSQPAWVYLSKPFISYFSRALRES